MPFTIYFLRHGQTEYSRNNAFCGSGLNPALTDAGQEMAQAFADYYNDTKWEAVYASSLQRTQITARPLCQSLGIEPEIRDGLKEIGYGKWEGKSVAEVEQDFHDDYLRWTADPAWHAPTGGENANTIARRSLEVIDEIRHKHESGNVLVVSHKATIRIMLCGLLGIDLGRFRYRMACPVGSVSIIEFSAQGPLLKTLADVRHLTDALRNLPGT